MSNNLFAYGAIDQLRQIKAHFTPERILLVTGRDSYTASGAQAAIEAVFSPARCLHFNTFDVNPKLADAIYGAELARSAGVDFILAVGGGSPIDMGKLIKAFYNSPPHGAAVVKGDMPLQDPKIPLVAVPTTAGSGSEATHFAVVYIGVDKFSLANPCLLPDEIVLDGAFIATNTPYQRAVNGLDALAQAIESYWARNATSQSRAYAQKAIPILVQHLPHTLHDDDPKLFQQILMASHFSGQAINISKTTAAHGFSYGFTSHYGIPHGHGVWLTLPEVFQIHIEAAKMIPELQKNMEILCRMLTLTGPDYAAELRDFLRSLDICPDMIDMGVKTLHERAFLARQVNAQRLSNNPVTLTQDHITRIFKISSLDP